MELRQAFEATPNLKIVWVMAASQINERSRVFIDELGLAVRQGPCAKANDQPACQLVGVVLDRRLERPQERNVAALVRRRLDCGDDRDEQAASPRGSDGA